MAQVSSRVKINQAAIKRLNQAAIRALEQTAEWIHRSSTGTSDAKRLRSNAK